MKSEKRIFGDRGEDAAALYLKKQHYRIIARNTVIGRREIDIIAESREALVFLEVKTRTVSSSQDRYGRACMAVNADKRRNLLAAARTYIATHPIKKPIRFDVIEVYYDTSDPPVLLDIHHMPDAFRA